jgi:hypothetical protein
MQGNTTSEGKMERAQPILSSKHPNALTIKRRYSPEQKVMLVALKVVLGLPRIPVVLQSDLKNDNFE